MKLTIAIIGLDNTGTGLAKRLVNGPYRLLLFDPDFSKAQALANQLLSTTPPADAEAIDCQVNASWEADIIVLAVPEPAKKAVADRIREVATCKIVISFSTSPNGIHNEHVDMYTGQALQQWLPDAKVVNVWITGEKGADVFLVSTHQEALTTVSMLVAHTGLNPVVVEDWSVSRTLDDASLSTN